MPALAPHDNANADRVQQERIGEEQHDDRVRRARAGSTRAGRRASRAATIAAIADARSTDGSKRVIAANTTTIASAVAVRGPSRSRRSSGAASAITNATFSPDTASRCERPGVAVVVDHRRRDPAGVAEQEAGDERARRRRERPGAAQDRPSRIAFATASRPRGDDSSTTCTSSSAADRVPPPRPVVVRAAAERREPAREHDMVAGLDHAQRRDVVAGRPARAACGARRARRRPGPARSPRRWDPTGSSVASPAHRRRVAAVRSPAAAASAPARRGRDPSTAHAEQRAARRRRTRPAPADA